MLSDGLFIMVKCIFLAGPRSTASKAEGVLHLQYLHLLTCVQVHKTSILLSTAKYNNSGSKSTDSMVMVVGVVVGVLGTVAIALIVAVIIISQRGKSTRKEETLIISDDS